MNKKNTVHNKIKVNVYLCAPSHLYYEMMILPDDLLGNLLKYIQNIKY